MGGNPTIPNREREDAFIERVWKEGCAHRRDGLPWRYLDDPYAVWVSEAMLQQTQVSRVMKYWQRWMATFPTVDALSSAAVSDVLELWQGLGYNRRALALKRAVEICSHDFGGRLPDAHEELLLLPGIGPATAAGIQAFARNKPGVYLETNVRTVYLHEFFPGLDKVPDRELIPLVERTCSQDNPREWYYALLDWGAHLKATGKNAARQSATYARQSTFEGSRRQKRAFLLREVLASPGLSEEEAAALLDEEELHAGREAVPHEMFSSILADLAAEGFFRRENGRLIP